MGDQLDHAPGSGGTTGQAQRQDGQRPRGSSGLKIGKVLGVPIYLSMFALVFAILIASMMVNINERRLPPDTATGHLVLLAAITAVGFLLSLLLHELGHALTALAFKLRVRSVTLHGFAGFTEIDPDPQTAGREFLVAFVGPAVNGVIAALCLGGQLLLPDGDVETVLTDLGVVNLALFVFNLAPGLPLDGGRLVVAAVWKATRDKLKGQQAGAYAGFVVAGAVGLWGITSFDSYGAVYMVLLSVFLAFGASQALRNAQVRSRLPGLAAGRLARKTLPVGSGVPLSEALHRAQEVGATAVAVIDRDGTPIKIMNGASVDALPEHRRPWMRIDEVSRTVQPSMIVNYDVEGEQLLELVQKHPASEYLVVQDGRPVGVLAMVDLVARIDPAAAARMVGQR
jgi:Zn-dependent protease